MELFYCPKKDVIHRVMIYDITYNSKGYPLFLIYLDGQWIKKSAKYFKPIEEIVYE